MPDNAAIADRMIGYAESGRVLSRIAGYPVTRQGVWQWWHRRERNGFPEGVLVPSASGRTSHRVFRQADVTAWYQEWRRRQLSPYSALMFTPREEPGRISLNGNEEPGSEET
jgi:hypothetical protein